MKTPIHFIGNAHLDPAWMWRLDEGLQAFLATCRSALDRMDETSEFIFTASSAEHYEFVEQTDPDLFKRIQQAVALGKWEIIGGWWVEADCHIPLGESLLRQALYGQRYFQEKFGKICATGYCIDSFGHNANLPQLLKHSGMNNYVFMRPTESDLTLPSSLFMWRSPSGDEVTAYRIPLHYSNFEHYVTEKIDLLTSQAFYDPSHSWMLFYGVGNHGGGPTKEQIAEIIKNKGQRADLDIRFFSVESFFASANKDSLPLYEGEMQPHAIGCYSAHSEIKQLNRRAENALLRAEKFCSLSEMSTGTKMDWSPFKQAWKNVLLNQFHDTLGGVSIKEACDDAINMYGEALAIASRQERLALQILSNAFGTSNNIETLIVFNPHGFALTQPIEFELWHPQASERGEHIQSIELIDPEGKTYHVQLIESSGKIGGDRVRAVFIADLPAFGWRSFVIQRKLEQNTAVCRVYNPTKGEPPPNGLQTRSTATTTLLSNDKVGICFDDTAKEGHLRYTPLAVYRDESDTWGHDITAFDKKIGEFTIKDIRVIESGPLRARVRVTSAFNNSTLEEDFLLAPDSDEVEVRCHLNFQEKNAVVKARFPVGRVYNPTKGEPPSSGLQTRSTAEIPYSTITRPSSPNEYPFGSWLFAGDEIGGIGLLSDSKSSCSCDDTYLSVTCARSPLYAHHVPPHVIYPAQTLRYLDQGEQDYTFRLVLGKKNWQEAKMPMRSLRFLQQAVARIESGHTGKLPLSSEMQLTPDADILIHCIKAAENGIGYIIRGVTASSEIKTFRINEGGGTECNAVEM